MAAAKIVSLRGRAARAAGELALAVGADERGRAEIAAVAAKVGGPDVIGGEVWRFVALSIDALEELLRAIRAKSARPHAALATWNAVLLRLEWGTGRITASREELAELAGCSAADTGRSLAELAKFGVLRREISDRRVRYSLNPRSAWFGQPNQRQAALTNDRA